MLYAYQVVIAPAAQMLDSNRDPDDPLREKETVALTTAL